MKDSCFVCANSGYSVKAKEIWCRCRSLSISINGSLNMICLDNRFERLGLELEEQRKKEFSKILKGKINE